MNIISCNKKTTWIDIEKPSKSDIEYLRQNFKFHNIVLDELMPDTIRTKVDNYDDYFYIVLHFPSFNKEKRTVHSQELDIIITKTAIITSHKETLIPLKAIFDKCNNYQEEKEKYLLDGPAKILYSILEDLLNTCFSQLDHISENIDRSEKSIFSGMEKQMIEEISIIKRNILDFRRAIKPQKQILGSLYLVINKFFGNGFSPFYNDLLGHHLRLWDTLDNYKELTESLETTNATLFTSKLNETIKILTIFTALLLPISIIVGIFGMNVAVPLQNHPQGFLIILGILIITLSVIYLFFKKRRII